MLDEQYIAHLPPLIAPSRNGDENNKKNRSRAYSGFVARALSDVTAEIAAKDVVDDFEDNGIDTIHYCQSKQTLYLVQAKLKERETFSQEEAQAFCGGIHKLLIQDFTHFNANVQARKTEIESALEDCRHIQPVVAYVGSELSLHAKRVLDDFLREESAREDRLSTTYIDFDAEKTVKELQRTNAVPVIDVTINLSGWAELELPRRAFYGTVQLSLLADLHKEHGDALFNKNIRLFLGQDTDVNTSILGTLDLDCSRFFYLNNGVTALCHELVPKGNPQNKRRLQMKGLSIINGAQTIATAAKYVSDHPGSDISDAKVLFTIIEIPENDQFGGDITKARNHQNSVTAGDFAALDAEQERLRREIASLGIIYTYKAVGANRTSGPAQIYIDEASQGLAIISGSPIVTAYLRDRPADFLDVTKNRYKEIFTGETGAYQTVNSVKFSRYVLEVIARQADATDGSERLTYRNGNYLLAWLLARQCKTSISAARIVDEASLPLKLSRPLDELRQIFFEETTNVLGNNNHSAFFKNQAQVKNLAKLIMVRRFGIVVDDGMRRREEANPDNYIEHLASLAPQIDLHE